MSIHPTALVAEQADLHPSVEIGPFCIVEAGAKLGEGCVIESHARIYANVQMGAHNRVCHGAAIGAAPQDLSYTPDKAKPLVIGDHNTFKENTVISIGVKTEDGTRIGSHNYFMNGSHLGHDGRMGDHNVVGPNSVIGGHVEIADRAFLSGGVAVHQFCHIGSFAMVGGVSAVVQDIPPFVMTANARASFAGLNLVGLKRNGFESAQRLNIKRAYKVLMQSGLSRSKALEQLQAMPSSPELSMIVQFVEASERGIISA